MHCRWDNASLDKRRIFLVMGKEKICVALDVDSFEEALDLTRRLSPWVGVFKIGSQLFTSEGSGIVKAVIEEGAEVFLDLKYHDIPNTVLNAARVALKLGVKMFNVHCLGGARMMRMLVDALGREAEITGKPMPLLLGVTVLTSLSNEELESELRVSLPLEEYVVHLAKLAQDAGMDGVVCSPHELVPIRRACGPNFTLVTPGIRPDWASGRDDQRRFTSPQAAFRAGADYIVVGRPITAANGPEDAAQRLLLELSS
uniref:Orotidine 5'-phosphate decarboxylase n=1 Tax=Candidatus Kentrum sp. MB TaxID=2138164 RepID=A0A450XEP7_9GAMM|nr:MAG: orotidine-5'-phosphate decarboxylase [Candidatus Kentron sp. MB]VFK27765.1 MAG: orotidine-5'-phosphate decarboxylase [Candidatus Kentron sp. MB]VFK74426.1 MAG: orotidine-5'-phosphate decarboxylase [Candidatus Kentron sp. MB]